MGKFSNAKVETLLLHRSIDHAIDLEPGYNLPYWWITIERSWVERSFHLSWVKWDTSNCVEWDDMLLRPDYGFGLKDPMLYGQIDEWLFSYDWQYFTGWIMGLGWRIMGRQTLWRSVTMTISEITELKEKSRNAAHTSAIMHRVETNGWKQLDHRWRWIMGSDGSQPEITCGLRWMTRDRSCQEMDNGQIWIANGYGLMTGGWWQATDLRSWITGDAWQWIFFLSVTILQWSEVIPRLRLHSSIWSYELTIKGRFASLQCFRGMAPTCTTTSTTQSTIQSTIQRYWTKQLYAQVTMPNSMPKQIPSHTATMPKQQIMKPYRNSY